MVTSKSPSVALIRGDTHKWRGRWRIKCDIWNVCHCLKERRSFASVVA